MPGASLDSCARPKRYARKIPAIQRTLVPAARSLDENTDPTATYPTLVGNILAAYEEYPFQRYRMDAVFYWPRLWLQVEKDTKEQIESEWPVADGFMLLSAIACSGGILWLIEALVVATDFADFHLPLGSPGLAFLGGLGLLVLGFVFYRFSIPFHRANGELFKSIYAVYRKKLADDICDPHQRSGRKGPLVRKMELPAPIALHFVQAGTDRLHRAALFAFKSADFATIVAKNQDRGIDCDAVLPQHGRV